MNKLFFSFIVSMGVLFSLQGEEMDGITAIYYLIQAPEEEIQESLDSIKGNKNPSFYRAMLYLNLCMRDWNKTYAQNGHKDLEKIESFSSDPKLLMVYKGISYFFLGRIKTLFGLKDMEKGSSFMKEIPLDEPDWVIRFLRGACFIELGRNLPDTFFFKEIIAEATTIGTADLLYVRELYKENGTILFDLSSYDRNKYAVPFGVYKFADERLNN